MKIVEVYKTDKYLESVPYGKDHMEFQHINHSPKVYNRGDVQILEEGNGIEVKRTPIRTFRQFDSPLTIRYTDELEEYKETFVALDPQLEDYLEILLQEKELQVLDKNNSVWENILEKKEDELWKQKEEKNNIIKELAKRRDKDAKGDGFSGSIIFILVSVSFLTGYFIS